MSPQSVDNNGSEPQVQLPKESSFGTSEIESLVLQEEPLFDPKPAIQRSTVLLVGFGIFVLAMLWPPLILLATYVASILLPYSFRVNDDGASRRKLLHRFEKEDRVSDSMREVPEDVHLESGYWTNARYVEPLFVSWEDTIWKHDRRPDHLLFPLLM